MSPLSLEPKEEKKSIDEAFSRSSMSEGDTYFLISLHWFNLWKRYVHFSQTEDEDSMETERPGRIKNEELLDENQNLKRGLLSGADYDVVPDSVWNLLQAWYGGGPEIKRLVIREGESSTYLRVEVFPFIFKVRDTLSSRQLEVEISKTAKVESLKSKCTEIFDVEMPARLWSLFEGEKRLLDDDMTVEDARLQDGQDLVLQVQNKNGGWPDLESKRTSSSSSSTTSGHPKLWEINGGLSKLAQAYNSSNSTSSSSHSPPSSPATSPVVQRKTGEKTKREQEEELQAKEEKEINPVPENGVREKKLQQGGNALSGAFSLLYSYVGWFYVCVCLFFLNRTLFFLGSPSNPVSSLGFFSKSNRADTQSRRGLCGLSNLGNTCFMNSALQCLSNTENLTTYFLEKNAEADINRTNPLGTKGKLAEEYDKLMERMWSGDHSAVPPRDLKWVIGKFAPQFSGYAQQDSQELLAFLLDGLHEDLNRVKQKQYVEVPDNDTTRPDEELAKESWERHLRRNQSVIVDVFQGQLKSTLVCPTCQKISVTFDPFMYLSLPIGQKKSSIIVIQDRLAEGKPPLKYGFTASPNESVGDLKAKISQQFGIQTRPSLLLLGFVSKQLISKTYKMPQRISEIQQPVLHLYILEPNINTEERLHLQGIHKQNDLFVGIPFLVNVEKDSLASTLYETCWKKTRLIVKNIEEVEKQISAGIFPFDIRLHKELICRKCDSSTCPGCLLVYSTENKIQISSTWALILEWRDGVVLNDQTMEEDPTTQIVVERKSGLSLEDCLSQFCETEKLGALDPWYCPSCKEHKQASKKFGLWSLPSVLVIHLKRFKYNRYLRDKIDDFVDFPVNGLDLSPFIHQAKRQPKEGESFIYDLFAVSNHSGGLGGGHYTAYCKNFIDQSWYSFNDSSVHPISASSVCSSSAYVLFYKRR